MLMHIQTPCIAPQQAARRVPTDRTRRQQCGGCGRQAYAPAALPPRASAAATASVDAVPSDQVYDNWLALPIQPGRVRRTVRRSVGPGVWVFEQSQGVLDVLVNIRMTVVKLRDGGLFVHAPIAPTRQCLSLLRELGAPVTFVVLPTSAVEHKVFLGPFAKCFPEARVYAAPGQWSFPLNLPLSALGLFPRKLDGTLADDTRLQDGSRAPWADEIEHSLLEIPLGLGPFVECAFFVKDKRTLLVTDTVVSVPEEPPEVCAADPRPLLVRSKDTRQAMPADTAEQRRVGWGKTILFALFFQPSAVNFSPLSGFTWADEWRSAFKRLLQPKLLVAPILQSLVLNKRPKAVRAWSRRVARWPFDRVIPAHLNAPIVASPRDFERAFSFLDALQPKASNPLAELFAALTEGPPPPVDAVSPFGDGDMRTIRGIDSLLAATGVIKGEQ